MLPLLLFDGWSYQVNWHRILHIIWRGDVTHVCTQLFNQPNSILLLPTTLSHEYLQWWNGKWEIYIYIYMSGKFNLILYCLLDIPWCSPEHIYVKPQKFNLIGYSGKYFWIKWANVFDVSSLGNLKLKNCMRNKYLLF